MSVLKLFELYSFNFYDLLKFDKYRTDSVLQNMENGYDNEMSFCFLKYFSFNDHKLFLQLLQ